MSITESVLLRSEKSVFWFATNGTKKWGWGGGAPAPCHGSLGTPYTNFEKEENESRGGRRNASSEEENKESRDSLTSSLESNDKMRLTCLSPLKREYLQTILRGILL
jgi:hypothetical protein